MLVLELDKDLDFTSIMNDVNNLILLLNKMIHNYTLVKRMHPFKRKF